MKHLEFCFKLSMLLQELVLIKSLKKFAKSLLEIIAEYAALEPMNPALVQFQVTFSRSGSTRRAEIYDILDSKI